MPNTYATLEAERVAHAHIRFRGRDPRDVRGLVDRDGWLRVTFSDGFVMDILYTPTPPPNTLLPVGVALTAEEAAHVGATLGYRASELGTEARSLERRFFNVGADELTSLEVRAEALRVEADKLGALAALFNAAGR